MTGRAPILSRLVAGAGWVVIAAAAIELTLREVARKPWLPGPIGGNWPNVMLVVAAALAAVLAYAVSPRPRPWSGRGTPLLFAVLFSAGIAAQLSLGARLQSDGFYYFAYLRSLAFDGDVEMSNDYRLLGLGNKAHLFNPTRTGYAQSAWTIGPAILWAPFFAAGHVVARELSEEDPNVTANGISFPYRQAVCVAGLTYGLLGCWFTWQLASTLTTRRTAAAATVLTMGGSFMLWYLVKEPSMTHAPSMALVAAFVWAWLATRERRSTLQWILLGLLAGFMTLVRWQNALFALLPACDSAVLLFRAWRRGDAPLARTTVVQGLLFTCAATFAFVPQMLAWRAIYGSWLAVSPVGPQMRFWDPRIVDILWSARNGLFSTAPVLYLGAIGLVIFARRQPPIGVPALLALAVMTWFNASVEDWWGSAGYGGRRFDGTLPLFAIGVAIMIRVGIEWARRYPSAVVATGGAALLLWNLTLMSAAQAGVVRIGEVVSFGDTMAAQARVFHRWFGNPFTHPISLAYALRNGVAPGRYDLLNGNSVLGNPRLQYARIDIGGGDEWLLEGGWHQPEREGPTTFRWASETAGIILPLHHVAPLRVQVRLHAFVFRGAPTQSITLVVNDRRHGPLPVEPGWHVVEFDVPAETWRAGVNRLTLHFGWQNQPANVGLGGDPRFLAAAVDYIRVTVP